MIKVVIMVVSLFAHAQESKPVANAIYSVFKAEKHYGKPTLGTITRHRGADTKEFKSIREACRSGEAPEGGDLFVLSKGLFLVDKKFACNGPIGGRITFKGQGAETVIAENSFVERKAAPNSMPMELDSIVLKNLVLVNAVLTDSILSNVYPNDAVTFENVLFDGSIDIAPITKNGACRNLPCFFGLFNMVTKPLFANADRPVPERQGAMLEVGTMIYNPQSKSFQVFEPQYEKAMSYGSRPKLKALVAELAAAKTKKPLELVKVNAAKDAAREMKANDPESYFPERKFYFEYRPDSLSPPASYEIKTFQEKLAPFYDKVLEKMLEGEI